MTRCKDWLANKLVNPDTGRKIKQDGPTYKKLEKECLTTKKTVSKTLDIKPVKKSPIKSVEKNPIKQDDEYPIKNSPPKSPTAYDRVKDGTFDTPEDGVQDYDYVYIKSARFETSHKDLELVDAILFRNVEKIKLLVKDQSVKANLRKYKTVPMKSEFVNKIMNERIIGIVLDSMMDRNPQNWELNLKIISILLKAGVSLEDPVYHVYHYQYPLEKVFPIFYKSESQTHEDLYQIEIARVFIKFGGEKLLDMKSAIGHGDSIRMVYPKIIENIMKSRVDPNFLKIKDDYNEVYKPMMTVVLDRPTSSEILKSWSRENSSDIEEIEKKALTKWLTYCSYQIARNQENARFYRTIVRLIEKQGLFTPHTYKGLKITKLYRGIAIPRKMTDLFDKKDKIFETPVPTSWTPYKQRASYHAKDHARSEAGYRATVLELTWKDLPLNTKLLWVNSIIENDSKLLERFENLLEDQEVILPPGQFMLTNHNALKFKPYVRDDQKIINEFIRLYDKWSAIPIVSWWKDIY